METQHDIDVSVVVGILARIINAAHRSKIGTASACPTCEVPTALLRQAQRELAERFAGTEYGSDSVAAACRRLFD